MSIRVMTWVWDQSRSKKTDRLVLLAIADCASDDGANAYPSMAELVRKTGLTDRGVQKAIARLAEFGELVVSRNGGPKGCNRYRVIMRTPEQGSPPNTVHPPNKVQGNAVHPPEHGSPPPPNAVRVTPEHGSPGTVLEPSLEPSVVQKLLSPNGSRDPRGSRLPDNFAPDADMKAWFAANCPSVDGPGEHAKFCDYWRAQAGAKGRKTDWPATWRNWMRKAADDAKNRRGRPVMTGATRHIDQRDDNPFRNGANATYASHTPGAA